MTYRQTIEEVLDRARHEHAVLLAQLSPELRASLPVDAAGITEAIDRLGDAVGLSSALRDEQARSHRANPAVLHGRVFGRTALTGATVLAAFVEAARVREGVLARLARAAGGQSLEDAVGDHLATHPLQIDFRDPAAEAKLRDAYAAQEEAALRIAAHLDARGD